MIGLGGQERRRLLEARRRGELMPIRAFVSDKSFGPGEIEILNAAFLGACDDLGLSDKKDPACEMVAKRVIQLAGRQRNPEVIRALVVASFRVKS